MRIWLSKPIYELLPYFYLVAGIVLLMASLYLNFWYWPVICSVIGFSSLALGFIVFLRRRDFRADRKSPPRPRRTPGPK